METQAAPADGDGLAEARARAFHKGISVGLVFPAVGWGLWMAFRTAWETPKYAQMFTQLGFGDDLPILTRLLISAYPGVSVALVLMAIACVVGTVIKGDKVIVAILNGTVFCVALGCQAILHVALVGPIISIQHRLGGG